MNRNRIRGVVGAVRAVGGFTLIEILISILILALGMLGLGILFPVIIREQRIGSDATTGIAIANNARTILTGGQWGSALPDGGNRHLFRMGPTVRTHPARDLGPDFATAWLWRVLRDNQVNAQSPLTANPPPPVAYGLGKGYSAQGVQFQPYGQGEWYTALINNDPNVLNTPVGTAAIGMPDGFRDPNSGTVAKPSFWVLSAADAPVDAKPTGHINVPISQRLYPLDPVVQPQFVWDFAVQRKSNFIYKYTINVTDYADSPENDDLRAVIFVRRIDPRIHFTGSITKLIDALPEKLPAPAVVDQRVPVGEDINGFPTLDGTNGDPANPGVRYSTIKTCEVEFWYQPSTPALNHPDRLYMPLVFASQNPSDLPHLTILWSQMKQPGQKLVDNLGNIYTVVGSGNEPTVNAQTFDGVPGGDYIRVDPPVPVSEKQASPAVLDQGARYPRNGDTIQRAIWQVCFTPQVPVSVNVVDLLKGNGQ
jgi:type II secretory pathway pseudopilin PulG